MLASRDFNSNGSLISHANIVREIFSRPVKLQEYVRGVRAGLKMAQTTSNSLNVSFVTKRNPLSLAHSTCCNAALKYSDGTSDGLLRKEKKKKKKKKDVIVPLDVWALWSLQERSCRIAIIIAQRYFSLLVADSLLQKCTVAGRICSR